MSINKYYDLGRNILFPICRSITGRGARKTLKILKKEFPALKIKNIDSGKKVYDWRVPSEWNINDAYILDKNEKKIVDFKDSNLHVVSYSQPINKILKKNELIHHIHAKKKLPTAIPYITSYYKKYWGFCCSYLVKKSIINNYSSEDKFKVVIESSFKKNGKLSYGELVLPGKSKKEILISTYICHPSMANNELSGIIISMALIKHFKKKRINKTIRFIFVPETIGSIAYLNKNLKKLKENVIGGYNLTCIGDNRMHSCMFTKYGNTHADRALVEAYKKNKIKYKIYKFLDRGSDERQFNAPGIDLPIASIFRTKYQEYPEYHTSLDNFDLVSKVGLQGGYLVAKTAINILLKKIIPKNKFLCEPFMSKKKLYPTLSNNNKSTFVKDIMNFLTYADGSNDLLIISKFIKKSYSDTKKIYFFLKKKKLLI
jgi:aminopeptidase-like protein